MAENGLKTAVIAVFEAGYQAAIREAAPAPTAPSTATWDLRECLSRVTDHLETWANDHSEERTSDIDAAIYCARKALAASQEQRRG